MKIKTGYLLDDDVIYKGKIVSTQFGKNNKAFIPNCYSGGFSYQFLSKKDKDKLWSYESNPLGTFPIIEDNIKTEDDFEIEDDR